MTRELWTLKFWKGPGMGYHMAEFVHCLRIVPVEKTVVTGFGQDLGIGQAVREKRETAVLRFYNGARLLSRGRDSP